MRPPFPFGLGEAREALAPPATSGAMHEALRLAALDEIARAEKRLKDLEAAQARARTYVEACIELSGAEDKDWQDVLRWQLALAREELKDG